MGPFKLNRKLCCFITVFMVMIFSSEAILRKGKKRSPLNKSIQSKTIPRGDVKRFDEYGFSFQLPFGYRETNFFKNEDNVIEMTKGEISPTFVIAATYLGKKRNISTESLLRESLETILEFDLEAVNFKEKNYDSIDGVMFSGDLEIGAGGFKMVKFAFQKNGFAYFLSYISAFSTLKTLETELDFMIDNFIFHEASNVDYFLKRSYNKTYKSDRYAIDLTGKPWALSPNSQTDLPLSDDVFTSYDLSNVIMYSTKLGLDLSKEQILKGLLRQYEIELEDGSINWKALRNDWASFSFKDNIEGQGIIYTRQFRVFIREDEVIYGLCITHGEDESFMKSAEEFFDSIHPRENKYKYLQVHQKMKAADLVNQSGIYFYEIDNAHLARKCFERAYQLNNTSQDVLINLVQVYEDTEAWTEINDLLQNQNNSRLIEYGLLAPKFLAYYKSGKKTAAFNAYKNFFAQLTRNDTIFGDFMECLIEEGRKDEALVELGRYVKKYPKDDVLIYEKYVRYLCEENYPIKEEYLKAFKKHHRNPDLVSLIMNLSESLDLGDVMLAVSDTWSKLEQDNPELYYYRSRGHLLNGDFEAAKTSMEKAIEMDDTDLLYQAYYRQLIAGIGKGSGLGVATAEVVPVELHESWSRIPSHIEELLEKHQDKDAIYASLYEMHQFYENAKFKRTNYYCIKVLNENGAKDFNQFNYSFYPDKERVYINELKVIDQHGKVRGDNEKPDYFIEDRTDGVLHTLEKALKINIRGLEPGSTIYLTISTESKNKYEEYPFQEQMSFSNYPIGMFGFCVNGEVKKIKYKKYNEGQVEVQDDKLVYSLKPDYIDQLMNDIPKLDEFLPCMFLVGGEKDWVTLGDEYLKDIEDHIQNDESMESWLKDFVKVDDSLEEKVKLVFNKIQRDFSYIGIEFGMRGIIPEFTGKTIENKYGDCKDLSLLLHQALTQLGVKSKLALVNTKYINLQKDLPSLNQFNHMVVAVEKDGKNYLFDPTTRFTPAYRIPSSLAGIAYLELNQGDSKIKKVDEFLHQSHEMKITREITLKKDYFNIREEVNFMGYSAQQMRHVFNGQKGKTMEYVEQFYENYIDAIQINSAKIEGLMDTHLPLKVLIDYETIYDINEKSDVYTYQPTPMWEVNYIRPNLQRNRTYPLYIAHHRNVKVENNFTNLKISDPNNWEVKDDCQQAKVEYGSSQKVDVNFVQGEYSPDFYSDYRRNILKTLNVLKRPLKLTK